MKKLITLALTILFSYSLTSAQQFLPHDLLDDSKFIYYPDKAISFDVDADGDSDLIVYETTVLTPRLLLFRNDGAGNFLDADAISLLPDTPVDIDYGDINGDGKKDVFVNMASNGLRWYENDGAGNFTENTIQEQAGSSYWNTARLGDIDDDGDLDIMGPGMWIKNTDGLGSFNEQVVVNSIYDLVNNPGNSGIINNVRNVSNMILEDLNGDGLIDVLYSSSLIYVQLFSGNLDGFDEPDTIAYTFQGSSKVEFATADLNNDTFVDLVIGQSSGSSGSAMWLRNNANASYSEIVLNNFGTAAISIGDFNGDDFLDLAAIQSSEVTGFTDNRISVFENNQNETFTRKNTFGLAPYTSANILADDFNNDGLDDLILTSSQLKVVHYRNVADWKFDEPVYLSNTSYQTTQMLNVDLNNDGVKDILMASYEDQNISWVEGLGDGVYGEQIILTDTISKVLDVGFADIDGDELEDIVYINSVDLGWLKNLDNGEFEIQDLIISDRSGGLSLVGPGNSSNIFDIVELDDDGLPNILFTQYYLNAIRAHNIDSDGTIASYKSLSTNVDNVSSATFGDLDGDDDLDVLATADGTDEVVVFKNTDGVFAESSRHSVSTVNQLRAVAATDLDGDGDLDILTGSPSWFENTDGAGTFGLEIVLPNEGILQGEEVKAGDLDGDGDMDFAITYSSGIKVYINDGEEVFTHFDIKSDGSNSANQLEIVDVNDDGTPDILSADVFMPRWYEVCFPTTAEYSEEACESLTINGETFTESGEFMQLLTNKAGCDSTLTLHITINPVFVREQTVNLCDGETFEFGSQNLTMEGEYTELFQTVHGCDSTVTVNLMVRPTFNETAAVAICNGETYLFGSQSLTSAGEFTELFQSQYGCDSTVMLNLKVNPIFNESATASICEGDTYTFGTQSLTVTGEYTELFQSASSCDSTVVLNLKVNPIFTETAIATICEGETYLFGSQSLTSAGEYTELFQSLSNCDSTVVLSLKVNQMFSESTTATICQGETFVFGSQSLDSQGDYTELFQSASGCDSTVVLTLNVNPVFSQTHSASICAGENFAFGVQNLTTTGEYTELFQSANGCDSTVVLNLSVNPASTESVTANICIGETYSFGSQILSSPGNYTQLFKTTQGCDSTVVLSLAMASVTEETQAISICEGEVYIFGSQSLEIAGDYSEVFTAQSGCDSLVNLNLEILSLNNEITITGKKLTATESNAQYQWFKCIEGGLEKIDGQVGQLLTVSESGEYAVSITKNGCETMSECIFAEATSVLSELAKDEISVFPIPVGNLLHVSLGVNYSALSISIYDMAGKLVENRKFENQNKLTMATDRLRRGVYQLIIVLDDQIYYQESIIKE
ncbi:MAG: T9SS type A sorting domain-containing protein [Imperialibacter sp.]|uniref:T9SS type A sorting domain-containing protein n=1 Tax=Imperialibacter sp. TaxID=2038411 RepID=UPI0032EEE8CA